VLLRGLATSATSSLNGYFLFHRKKSPTMKISATKTLVAYAVTNGRCWYCGIALEPVTDYDGQRICENWFVLDHVIPLSNGGTNAQSNLVASCWKCNNSKNNKSVEQYRFHLLRLSIGMPRFNQEQLDWLAANGFVMPHHEPIVFWAEKPGNLAVRP
jgi:5-methylcytosine-specific restriction endonuclease McrA